MVVEMTSSYMDEPAVKSSILKKISRNLSAYSSFAASKASIFQVKQKSHEELDIEIQSGRILYVLDELIAKLETAAAIPKLIDNDGALLRKWLPEKDADFVLETCKIYTDTTEETEETRSEGVSVYSGIVESSKTDHAKGKSPSHHDNKLDTHIQQAIAIVCESQNLRKHLREIKDPDQDELSWLLIDGAKRLRAAAAHKLAVSANEERERERELRKAWKENAEARVLLENIQEKLNKQKEELAVQLNAKDELINTYNEKIDALKAKFKEDIKKRIVDSEKSMIQKSQVSEETQTQLQQESKELVHNYWALLDQHLASEKLLRAKKIKVEAQLANWLAKYDQDIGERQTELEDLQRLYDEETEELNALQRKFDEQEEEYIELMAERDDYERKIYEERAFIFLMNRAARRIQRYWRAYRERKRLRKKARKAKKKEKGSASESGGESAKKKSAASEKGKKDKKGKKGKKGDVLSISEDPMAKLESKFKGDILEDIGAEPVPTNVTVEL